MADIDQAVVDAVIENKDKNDNELLSMIVGMGVMFTKARGVLTSILESNGLRMTKEQRDEKAGELMTDFTVTAETTADEVNDQIELLVDELDCKASIARAYVRAAFAEEELEMPKVSKASGPRAPRTPGFNGDAGVVCAFLIANKDCTKDEFIAHMEEKGLAKTKNGADKASKWWSTLEDLRIFGNQYCS